MSNRILIISDIHIHDYPQRNPSEKFRLYQARTVAQNIIEAGKREGAEEIIIAGDIVEKAVIRPYVQAEVKYFLDTLMEHFKRGFLILGNHDVDNKTSDQEFTDSVLGVMLPPNLFYAHKRIVQLGKSSIAFCNWMPEFDLSWIPGKVDCLITHATIAYTKDDKYNSQILDESKFDIAFCGDIHKPDQTGKYVSIGIPQRCKLGDSDKCTGIIFDCDLKKWKWTDLNPQDNLLKFRITHERDEEGFDQATNTWSVYRPDNLTMDASGNITGIQVPEWSKVDELIQKIIDQNDLSEIHGEILNNVHDLDANEVDFNFTLTRLYCKNWRSIEELELFFGHGDKILVKGDNGAGKSSILTAIKYAFIENPHYKDFIRFGTSECYTEVDFIYQGNNYRIRRGKNSRGAIYGFWINGEQQKYNNSKLFSADMKIRFPFTDYMDIMFLENRKEHLLDRIKDDRKSDIISKFFKLDKIDTFHETASRLYESTANSLKTWDNELDKNQRLVKYLGDRLKSIQKPALEPQILEKKKAEGLELQNKWMVYNNYMTKTANLQGIYRSTLQSLKEYEEKIKKFRDSKIVQAEKDAYQEKYNTFSKLYQDLLGIKTTGKRLYQEKIDLDKKKVCPSCGQPIKNNKHFEAHKNELEGKIKNLVDQQNLIYKTFSDSGIGKDALTDQGSFNGMVLNSLNQEIVSRMSELNEQVRIRQDYERGKKNLESVKNQIRSLGTIPEKVILPENFMKIMSSIETDLATWRDYLKCTEELEAGEREIKKCQDEIGTIKKEMSGLRDYILLTGSTGEIYKEILTRLAETFTDNFVKYEVREFEFMKKKHLDLELYYLKSNLGFPVPYQSASSGEKSFMDINFLSKIVAGGLGLAILDEYLSDMSQTNTDNTLESICQMNLGCFIFVSHSETLPAFNNKLLGIGRNQAGITIIRNA